MFSSPENFRAVYKFEARSEGLRVKKLYTTKANVCTLFIYKFMQPALEFDLILLLHYKEVIITFPSSFPTHIFSNTFYKVCNLLGRLSVKHEQLRAIWIKPKGPQKCAPVRQQILNIESAPELLRWQRYWTKLIAARETIIAIPDKSRLMELSGCHQVYLFIPRRTYDGLCHYSFLQEAAST